MAARFQCLRKVSQPWEDSRLDHAAPEQE
jgi:hypothetical protein